MADDSNTSISSDGSTESDKNSLSSYLPPSGARKSSRGTSNTKRISGSLKETADALQDVDRMLGQYHSIANAQASSINKLKEKIGGEPRRTRRSSVSSLRSSDLEYSTRDRGRRRYRPTSPLRDYQYSSDQEHRSSRRMRRPRSAVRFHEDVRVDKEHLHDIHKSVRDLSADHERLESELEREIRNRYRHERDHERSLHELNTSVRQSAVGRTPSIEHVERRLERKLENIATKIEKRQKSEPDSSAGGITAATLSKSLTDALRASQTNLGSSVMPNPTISLPTADTTVQHRIADLETDKRRLQNDLDLIKQKHDQGEGARRALTLQVEDLRVKLREMDDERHRAIRLAEEFKDSEKRSRKKQRDISRLSEDENQRQQMEIQDLKVQLSHSLSREEVEVMRRELQKNEKQRGQLTEHIESLTKDLRSKEHHTSTLLADINDLSNQRSRLETDNSRLQGELESEREKYKAEEEKTKKAAADLSSLQSEFDASTKHKEEMKTRATDVVKMWKAKCKALQKDSDEMIMVNSEQASRYDQLSVDNDSLRNQLSAVSNQMDKLTKEMADLLSSNQDLEEKVRKYHAEIKDLRKVKADLEQRNHEQLLQIQQFERDGRRMNDQFINYEAESAQLTDKLTATKDQLDGLEQQYRHVKAEKADMQAELAKKMQLLESSEAEAQDLQTKLMATEASESTCKRECETLLDQLNRQQFGHERTSKDLLNKLDKLKKELSEVKSRETKTGEEYHRRFKHLQADKDAQVESMRVDLEEAHLSVQNVKKQAKAQGEEFVRLQQRYSQLEDDYTAYKQQTRRLKEQTDDLRELGDQQDMRCKELESSLSVTKEESRKLEQQYGMLTQAIRTELQVLVETAEAASTLKYSETSSSSPDILTEIASRTTWLRRYLRTAQDTERQLKAEMQMRLSHETSEKAELLGEIKRQQEAMDEMGSKHKALVDDVMAREDEVVKLEDKLTELSHHVEEQKALDDAVEKTKILERYQRLQSAVSSLKHELRSTSSLDSLESKDAANNLRQRQVRISEIVSNNDGTRTLLRSTSPPNQHGIKSYEDDSELQERIDAYSKALGPNSYRPSQDDEDEVRGVYINELDDRAPSPAYDSNYRNSGSYHSDLRRHSTPRKTPVCKS
ncbi:centrosomal protein of 128 kDa-like isoform X2 [Watersipora subatra]|uniref:centrosomal protein of 128 kDa-like isoform X2 n=1 Tax=Watersipora subatra TaxID=2589382 RepID=UPI00355B8FE5